jgi:hypothetical protein
MESAPQNCVRTSERFWMPNVGDLITHISILPKEDMSLGAKLNSIMRLSLIIFVVLMIIHFKYAIPFLVIASIINIAFYMLYKNKYD